MPDTKRSTYKIVRTIWRTLPAGLRRNSLFAKLSDIVRSRFRSHNQGIYTTEYFLADVEDVANDSSNSIVESICEKYNPMSVVDVGCGTGALLERFAHRGITVLGLEYSDAGRKLTSERGVPVHSFDVRHDNVRQEWPRFDVVCCTEVAEHIPGKHADRLVQILTSLGQRVVFTAATPGQGGTDHVNEQPREYWIEKFSEQTFTINEELTSEWRDNWKGRGVAYFYWHNLMVFESK